MPGPFYLKSATFQARRISLAGWVAVFLLMLAALPATAPVWAAQPAILTEEELAGVTGQAGITIYTSIATRYTASVLRMSDTDSTPRQWLELRNVTVDDGSGGYFLIRTPFDYSVTPAVDETLTFDVGTNTAGRTLFSYRDSLRVSPRWYTVDDLVFCNQSLGGINLDALSVGTSYYRMGAHADGTGGGFDYDYTTRVFAQALRYKYNTTPETLIFSGIHLANSATGPADDPANPATWSFTGAGNVFRIGDMDSGNPAKLDVITDSGVTSLFLNLPMEGSLRVENVTFGGNNFGPVAIDNIHVHRLSIQVR